MYDIYYAHHRWKYGTEIEKYELDLIRSHFPNARICNPATDIELPNWLERETPEDEIEHAIMEECLQKVDSSDILIFSSVNGSTGIGVFTEVERAQEKNKLILYVHQGELCACFDLSKRHPSKRTDRIYADVYLP